MKFRCADAIIKILEKENIKYVFGHPGEHVLPLLDAIRKSKIKHVLFRHEQGAIHAADGYARANRKFAVCLSTGGPGALNFVMGVATAYKDSVPLLILTGDIPTNDVGKNVFQEVDICGILKPITLESFDPLTPEDLILSLKKSLKMLKYGPTGPIHINLHKDILEERVSSSLVDKKVKIKIREDKSRLSDAIDILKSAKRLLILAGGGVLWAGASKILKKIVKTKKIPLVTTYPARGVINEYEEFCLGMIGLRGTKAANFAGKTCDVLLALGAKLTERTLEGIGNPEIIQVNLDKRFLKGDVNLQMDVKEFLEIIEKIDISVDGKWLKKLKNLKKEHMEIIKNSKISKTQQIIKKILEFDEKAIIVNDAGSHTTWVTLCKKVVKPRSLIFSGSFGPMGYGLPAAIGVKFAKPNENVIVIVGDGGFQMTLQELATIKQYNLPILICVLNNQSLNIIRQWQEMMYNASYSVELKNPDFVKLAKSYGIKAMKVKNLKEINKILRKALEFNSPFLIEIRVPKENIPLPKTIKEKFSIGWE